MRFTILLALLVFPAAAAAQSGSARVTATENQCVTCHSRLMRNYAQPALLYHNDVHAQAGLLCSDCHGGNPTNPLRHDPDDPEQKFLGKPAPRDIPSMCDKCHGDPSYMRRYNPSLPVDQLEKYRTSRHGELLLGQGDPKPAHCVSCHSVHDIRQANNPASPVYAANLPATCSRCHSDSEYMAGYGIPVDQYEKYRASVHGQALLGRGDTGAPACNDCHGNHGAFPPEAGSIAQVCGMCHVRNDQLYEDSFHASIFEALEVSGCETCHGYHEVDHPSTAMLGAGDISACGACHSQEEDDPGFALGLEMKSVLDSLSVRIEKATALVAGAGRRGMEVSELEFNLRDIRQSLIESRTAIHSFDPEQVRESARPGLELVAQVDSLARLTLVEHGKRRWWLGGATLVLLAIIGGVALKMRRVEEE